MNKDTRKEIVKELKKNRRDYRKACLKTNGIDRSLPITGFISGLAVLLLGPLFSIYDASLVAATVFTTMLGGFATIFCTLLLAKPILKNIDPLYKKRNKFFKQMIKNPERIYEPQNQFVLNEIMKSAQNSSLLDEKEVQEIYTKNRMADEETNDKCKDDIEACEKSALLNTILENNDNVKSTKKIERLHPNISNLYISLKENKMKENKASEEVLHNDKMQNVDNPQLTKTQLSVFNELGKSMD